MQVVSVIVPVYYNEGSLKELFEQLLEVEKQLEEKELRLELIFIDDGSGDNSLRELLEIKRRRESVKVVKLTRNFGSLQAVKAGLQYVTGDCFSFLAADLQDPPDKILDMAERWLAGSRYVVCIREKREDPAVSRFFAAIYYGLLRFFVVSDYPRGGYDMALMDRALLPYMQRIGKNVNISLFAHWLGFKPDVIRYARQKREHGKSRWTFSKKVKLFLDSFLGFSILPIRLISLIGLAVSLVSFGYGTSVIVSALLGNAEVRGFAALATLISFLLGMVIVMLGVIGEYLWRIADETNRRPETVIEKVY